ncbi:uncharacterized protein LOC132550231 [Ylistrum balloti]|uniref:uncharacterized protein LOC132550231 n=1 Tax=Ylistrum balloti TaxID=509963 RepID=UPI002905F0A3|nr:uncharacterized protein LOC132550231 [Ylistrum balloti]
MQIRIAALNDSSSEDDSRAPKTPARRTKEAKESEAFTLYDAALRLQRQGEVSLAETAFKDLLNHGFLRETAQLVEDEEEGADQDGLRLLYSIHKNLASMALHREDLQSAIWSYVEAVKIDTTEVTVWYKIGTIALKLYNFPLARLGFEKGLHCNPNHWPCLDHVITLLYAMNDYWNCLYYISRALLKDPEYTKGLVLRKQILKEHPSLKYDTDEMFEQCDQAVLLARVDPSESDEYVNEALDLRDRRRELAKEPEPLPIKLSKTITHFTWRNLGESLVELYDRARNADPPLSLGLRVDLSEYSNCTERPPVVQGKSPAIEESPEHSGEMEVDSVPVVTSEKKTKDDTEMGETNSFEVRDIPMISEEPAGPLESQTDNDHVAMDIGSADIQNERTASSFMPSASFRKMPSSPLSTPTVSQASIIGETDSPLATADVEISQKTADTGLPFTTTSVALQVSASIVQPLAIVPELQISTSEEALSILTNKENKPLTGSVSDLQESTVSEPQENLLTLPLMNTSPKMSSERSTLEQMSDASEPMHTSGLPVSLLSELPDRDTDIEMAQISSVSKMQQIASVAGMLPTTFVSTISRTETSQMTTASGILKMIPHTTTVSGIPLSTMSEIQSSRPISGIPLSTMSEILSSRPISGIPLSMVPEIPSSRPISEIPLSTVPEIPSSRPISGIPLTVMSEIPYSTPTSGIPLTTSGIPSSVLVSGIPLTTMTGTPSSGPTSGIPLTATSGIPSSAHISGTPLTTMSGAPSAVLISGIPLTTIPGTPSTSGIPFTTMSGTPSSTPASGLSTAVSIKIPAMTPVSESTHISLGILTTTTVSGNSLTTTTVSGNSLMLSPGTPVTTTVSGIPQTTLFSGVPVTTSSSGIPQSMTVSETSESSPDIPVTVSASDILQPISVSEMPYTLPVSDILQTTPVATPVSTYMSVHTPVTGLTFTTPSSGLLTTSSPLFTPVSGMQHTSPISVFISPALHDHTCAASIESEELAKGRGKAPKRKRGFIPEDFGLSVKRRSARVRNVSKPKEEPSVNFEELLISFLPSSLKQVNEDDDTEMLVMKEQEQSIRSGEEKATGCDVELIQEVKKLTSTEDTDVREFLKQNIKNGGTICLMLRYLFALAKRGDTKWPHGLTDVYLKVYSRTRKHFDLPDIFSLSDSEEYTQNLGKTCQLAAEFQLDHWIVNNRLALSPGSSPRSPGSQQLHTSDLPPHCNDDLWFITGLTGCGEVMGSNWLPHCIRVYWMKARFYMLQGKMDDALFCFQKTLEYLEYAEKQGDPAKICLVNCKMDRTISIDQVKSHQESLHRCQSLEETQKLYESGNYDKVVDFILQTDRDKQVAFSAAIPERQSQLLLLQDSLYKMDAHKKGMVWGEVSFNEAVQCYRKATTSEQKDAWSTTLTQICQNLIRVLDKKEDVLKDVPKVNLTRLSRNLISIIDITMAAPDSAVEMPIGTVLPWILLYKLIKFEEDKIRSMQVSTPETRQADLFDGMPSYLMLLNIAHEYLARHSWCTKSNGSLLLFYLDVAQEFLTGSYQFKHDLEQSYEQCVYCLFGHPNKKGRARHLMDHNSAQIDLTWDSAQKIFEYFKPNSVPEFDSYKADAVSADVESLLKRIAQLVPESEKPAKLMENLQDYIEGNTNIPPNPDTKHLSTVSKELYYLLADYYFKNKEQAKAVRFYMSDICMNPTRLDSWAGMGLARMSQLEQKLSSTALKMDMPIYRKSIGALRCFRRAVEIDDSNAKLWIEYGSLAYQLHSHASRQLKWKNWFPLTEELEQIASDSRQEMLQTAFNCYKKASECESDENEEEWLQHYMMAKCLEKMRKPAKEYLDHYKKAAGYLYEENATFPKKIVYAYTTPHLAVESLEMFYRIHVSIMKILLKNKTILESDMQLFQQYIKEAANSPFARCQEKRQESMSTVEGTSLPVGQGPKSGGKKSKVMSMDHTYSKQKNLVEASGTDPAAPDVDRVVTPKPVSGVTHREVKVIDSSKAAGSMMELSAENLDEHLNVAENVQKKEEKVGSVVSVEKRAVSDEQGQGDMAVDSEVEGDGFFLDEFTGIVKQTSFGFDVKDESHKLDRGDSVESGTKDKSVDKIMERSSQEGKSDDIAMEGSSLEGKSADKIVDGSSLEGKPAVKTVEGSSLEGMSGGKMMEVSSQEDRILFEDKPDRKKTEKDNDSSPFEYDEDILLSDLSQDQDIPSPGEDRKSHDLIPQSESPKNDAKSSPHKEEDGQEEEKSYHSDVRELSQGNESMESETRQYGDMNLSEDQEGGTAIDPSELSLSKGLRERMAQELEGELVSKCEQGPSVVGMETDSKTRKDQKSEDSLSDGDDLGESLEDSFLSDSLDSIPETLESRSRSVGDSLSKSGDSLSKSGGFLAQFNQFLSKNIIPDDIISESSPEKSLSSSLKASRSQSPSSQILISDADTGLKISSQQDTISSQGIKEDLTSFSSNLSSKHSTQYDSTNQNRDDNDSKDNKIETLLANQNSDKKESSSMDETFKNDEQSRKIGMEDQQNIGFEESKMEVDQIRHLDDGKCEDIGDTCDNKDEEAMIVDETENPSQIPEKEDSHQASTANQGQRVDDRKTLITEKVVDGKNNLTERIDNEKINVIEKVDDLKSNITERIDEKMDVTEINPTNQGQNVDNGKIDSVVKDSTTYQGQKAEDVKVDVSNVTSSVSTEQKMDDVKMDVDDNGDKKKLNTGSSKSVNKESAMLEKDSVSKKDEGVTSVVGGRSNKGDQEKLNTKDVKEVPVTVEKKKEKKDKISTESNKSKVTSNKPGSSKMHKQLIEQCMAALCLCLARFPTHYKSLYRLAYTYVNSPYHKNLQYAHDLLLGNPDWKMMAHMPAQGLFVDRKPNNFFQGVWKIPVDEIDRSGSFPSHLTRSVKLLLKVLKDQKDVPKLHSIFLQLSRDPDSGKKYMRDAERIKFARLAHQYCLDAIRGRLPELRQCENYTRAVKCLMEVYKVYNYISFKMDISQTIEANELLEDTFKAVMGKKVLDDEEVLEQAIRFCQEEVQRHKARQWQPSAGKNILDTSGKDGCQSDSSLFSPEKPVSSLSKVGGQNQGPTTLTQGSKLLEKEKKVSTPQLQENVNKATPASVSFVGKQKQLLSPVGGGAVKQSTGKPGNQLGPGRPAISGVQKSSPSTQKSSLFSNIKTNIPKEKEKVTGDTRSKSILVSGKGASGFKPYNPNDSLAPSPVTTPATPYTGLSPKFDFSKKNEPAATSQPVKKIIEVIEISSSDDESDAKANPEKTSGDLSASKGSNPIQIGGAHIETGGNPGSFQKGENLRTLLVGGEYHAASHTGSTVSGGKSTTQSKGGSLPTQRPYPTGIILNKGSNQVKQLTSSLPKDVSSNLTKPSQKPHIPTSGQRGSNSTGQKFNQPSSQVNPGYVMYGAKVTAPSQKSSSSLQASITDDADLSEKEDKTYQPSEDSSSDDEQYNRRTSKTKLQLTSHPAARPSKSKVKAPTLQDEPIRIVNAETGQVVDSDSQKSDLVTDPEKLFFDVKDWLEDL